MSCTDRSQTERIRRLRGKIQAVRREECAACPELGPQGPTDQSTWLNRRFGQATYYKQIATGAVVAESCCGPSGPCCIGTVNFTDYENYIAEPNTKFTVISSDCDTMTFTVMRNDFVSPPITLPIRYVQNDFEFNVSFLGYVTVNNSDHPIIITFAANINPLILSPCGAVPGIGH